MSAIDRFVVMLAVLVGYWLFRRWTLRDRVPPAEVGPRSTADVPPLLLIAVLSAIGDRLLAAGPAPFFDRAITPGYALGAILGVGLSGPLRRAGPRWFGLAEERA